MKSYLIYFFVLFNNFQVDIHNQKSEIFSVFFKNFNNSRNFQLSRIIFPLTLTRESEEEMYKKLIKSSKWEYVNFENLKKSKKNIIAIKAIKDNIVDVHYSVEDTGVSVHHYFRQVNGKWFLYHISDQSN